MHNTLDASHYGLLDENTLVNQATEIYISTKVHLLRLPRCLRFSADGIDGTLCQEMGAEIDSYLLQPCAFIAPISGKCVLIERISIWLPRRLLSIS